MVVVARISISLPEKLLERFDSLIGEMGYANRSEAIRDAIRDYITKNEPLAEGEMVTGVVVITYGHEPRNLPEVLLEVQHSFKDEIRGAFHVHLDEENCLEVVVVEAEAGSVRKVRDKLTSIKGVKQTGFFLVRPSRL